MINLKDLIPEDLKQTLNKKSKGLGDTIEKITEVTKLKEIINQVAGDDCGCNERKEKLNKMFPYNPNGNWLSQRFQ